MMVIPESKWFGKYSLALKAPNCVAKPRRNPGFAYVLRLVGNFDSGATKILNHFVSGIVKISSVVDRSEMVVHVLKWRWGKRRTGIRVVTHK